MVSEKSGLRMGKIPQTLCGPGEVGLGGAFDDLTTGRTGVPSGLQYYVLVFKPLGICPPGSVVE